MYKMNYIGTDFRHNIEGNMFLKEIANGEYLCYITVSPITNHVIIAIPRFYIYNHIKSVHKSIHLSNLRNIKHINNIKSIFFTKNQKKLYKNVNLQRERGLFCIPHDASVHFASSRKAPYPHKGWPLRSQVPYRGTDGRGRADCNIHTHSGKGGCAGRVSATTRKEPRR